jgi:hypothetical protein
VLPEGIKLVAISRHLIICVENGNAFGFHASIKPFSVLDEQGFVDGRIFHV